MYRSIARKSRFERFLGHGIRAAAVAAVALAAGLFVAEPAHADSYYHYGYGHPYKVKHYKPKKVYYYAPPTVYYAPPPVYYAPPPRVVYPAPSVSFGFSFPIH